MNAKIISKGILWGFFQILLYLSCLYVLWLLRSIILYVLIAAIITLISRPIAIFFKKRFKLKNTLSALITILIVAGLVTGFFFLLIPLVVDQASSVSDQGSIPHIINDNLKSLIAYFESLGFQFDSKKFNIDFSAFIDFSTIGNTLNFFANFFSNLIIGLFTVLFLSFSFLQKRRVFTTFIYLVSPEKKKSRILKTYHTIVDLISRYLLALLVQWGMMFILYGVLLFSFDLEHALILALICAFINWIPYIGALVNALIIALFTFTQYLDVADTNVFYVTLTVLIIHGAIQFFDGFIAQPIIFSNSVHSQPVEIFLAVLVFGSLFGILGLLIAVPAYTILKAVLMEFFPQYRISNLFQKTK